MTTLARPSLSRLTEVELRKMTDTRAGFWLQLAVAGATLAITGVVLVVGHDHDKTLPRLLEAATAPAEILLPVVGILLVSSEWSQRTALITFALVPERSRVVVAKLAAGVVLALVALAGCLAVAVPATAIGAPGIGGTWALPPWLLGQLAVLLATSMIIGVGFGAMLLSSAPAIVLSFVLPIAWAALGSINVLTPAARWLDPSRTTVPFSDHMMSGLEWARAGTSLALWMLVPLLIGVWRITRGEVHAA